jgi:hypothetical protein
MGVLGTWALLKALGQLGSWTLGLLDTWALGHLSSWALGHLGSIGLLEQLGNILFIPSLMDLCLAVGDIYPDGSSRNLHVAIQTLEIYGRGPT